MITQISMFYWIIGLLEGEGCFQKPTPSSPNQIRIILSMTDEDVVAQAAAYFNKAYYKAVPRKDNWKPCFIMTIKGKDAYNFLLVSKSFFSSRRQTQIDSVLASYDPDKRTKYHTCSRRLSDEVVTKAKSDIASGLSLREVSRHLGVHHESLRRRIGAIV